MFGKGLRSILFLLAISVLICSWSAYADTDPLGVYQLVIISGIAYDDDVVYISAHDVVTDADYLLEISQERIQSDTTEGEVHIYPVGSIVGVFFEWDSGYLYSMVTIQDVWEEYALSGINISEDDWTISYSDQSLSFREATLMHHASEPFAVDLLQPTAPVFLRGLGNTVWYIEVLVHPKDSSSVGFLNLSLSGAYDDELYLDGIVVNLDIPLLLTYGEYNVTLGSEQFIADPSIVVFTSNDQHQVITVRPLETHVPTGPPGLAEWITGFSPGEWLVAVAGIALVFALVTVIILRLMKSRTSSNNNPVLAAENEQDLPVIQRGGRLSGRGSANPRQTSRSTVSQQGQAFSALTDQEHSDETQLSSPVVPAVRAVGILTHKPIPDIASRFPTPMCFEIYNGDLVYIIGQSGSGKTVLMKMLGGYDKRISGELTFFGNLSWERDDRELRRQIGYVPQIDSLYGNQTAFQMLEYYSSILAISSQTRARKRPGEILTSLGLEDKAQRTLIRDLSGGQRKRVSIAIELLRQPRILLLDEPDSGLDPDSREELHQVLKRINVQEETTIIMTTHYTENIKPGLAEDIPLFFGEGLDNQAHMQLYAEIRSRMVQSDPDFIPGFAERTQSGRDEQREAGIRYLSGEGRRRVIWLYRSITNGGQQQGGRGRV